MCGKGNKTNEGESPVQFHAPNVTQWRREGKQKVDRVQVSHAPRKCGLLSGLRNLAPAFGVRAVDRRFPKPKPRRPGPTLPASDDPPQKALLKTHAVQTLARPLADWAETESTCLRTRFHPWQRVRSQSRSSPRLRHSQLHAPAHKHDQQCGQGDALAPDHPCPEIPL